MSLTSGCRASCRPKQGTKAKIEGSAGFFSRIFTSSTDVFNGFGMSIHLLDHVFADNDLVLARFVEQIVVVAVEQLERLVLGLDALYKLL